jgi:hypothetical protein
MLLELNQIPRSMEESKSNQLLFANSDRLDFLLKEPFRPSFMVCAEGAQVPCTGGYDSVKSQLLDDPDFMVFETPEGAETIVNVRKVVFVAVTETIGQFNFLFAGKMGLTVVTTTYKIKLMFCGQNPTTSSIIS